MVTFDAELKFGVLNNVRLYKDLSHRPFLKSLSPYFPRNRQFIDFVVSIEFLSNRFRIRNNTKLRKRY